MLEDIKMIDEVAKEPWPIYVDGSYRGKDEKMFCGYGIFYGKDDVRNQSVSLPDANNQRAELTAILHALQNIHDDDSDQQYCIRTDSDSSIQSITLLLAKWEKNGWRTKKKLFVKNRDLIQPAFNLYREIVAKYRKKGWKFQMEHIKGHSGDAGNEGADFLAVQAAAKLEAEMNNNLI